MGIKENSLALTHVSKQMNGGPRQTYVSLMMAAAVSGHIIARTREEMHKTLDDVFDLAEAALLHATETKQ